MRYHLALIPDRGDGEPDYGMNPIVLAPLPEGAVRLFVDTSWTRTGPDGKFSGGMETISIELKEVTGAA